MGFLYAGFYRIIPSFAQWLDKIGYRSYGRYKKQRCFVMERKTVVAVIDSGINMEEQIFLERNIKNYCYKDNGFELTKSSITNTHGAERRYYYMKIRIWKLFPYRFYGKIISVRFFMSLKRLNFVLNLT